MRTWAKVIAITLVASLAVVIAPPNEAQASHCGSDTWADGDAWSDNYWVGYNTAGTKTCDLNGNYTTGVQRINWYAGYRQSSIDGYYGANTHQDVRSFQAFKSLPVDGLVGSNTWTAYRNQLTFTGVNGALDLYKTAGSGSNWFAKDVVEIGHKWYTRNVANNNWVQFGTSGPN